MAKDYSYKKTPCAICGKQVWKSRTPAADGLSMCRPCRAPLRGQNGGGRRPEPLIERTCPWCLGAFSAKGERVYCSRPCANRGSARSRSRSRTAPHKGRRKDRERVAPGLSVRSRTELLHAWRRSGVRCAFCPEPATTVDHLIPLSRGGTNYEGNLAPCCRRCNSSKSDLLVSEWRLGKPSSGSVSCSPWLATALRRAVVVKVDKPKPVPIEHDCMVCGVTYSTTRKVARTCGNSDCMYEYAKRQSREKYREEHGLPPTWERPTKPWSHAARPEFWHAH